MQPNGTALFSIRNLVRVVITLVRRQSSPMGHISHLSVGRRNSVAKGLIGYLGVGPAVFGNGLHL